jgi:anti-sigma factor RsiW
MSAHLTPEQVASYIDGRLSLAEFNNANDHMADCRECTSLLAGTVRSMAAIAQYLPEDEAPSTSWRLWAAIAVGCALGCAIAAVVIAWGCV